MIWIWFVKKKKEWEKNMACVIMKCLKGHERVTKSKWLWCRWKNVKLWALYVNDCAGTPVYGIASRRKWHMLQLENQRLQVLAEVMFGILQLKNQHLQEVETWRGYVVGMPYLTCESDCVDCESKLTNELITCDRTRHASSLLCICILLDMVKLFVIVFLYLCIPYCYS